MRKHHILSVLILYTVFYFAVCLIFKASGYTNEYYVLISVATFLYGIFIAFSIYNHQSRLSRVRELLRTDDSYLLAIYRQCAVFGEHTQNKLRSLIDNYLITQIDYKIQDDYHASTAAYRELNQFIIELKPNTATETAAYQSMLSLTVNSSTTRKLVGTLVSERTTRLEWFSVVTLHLLIAYLVFSFNTGTVVSSLLSTLIVITGVVMIIVLYELNTLTWQEEKWIWNPLHNLFLDLDLLPYYPINVIQSKRTKVPSGSQIRLGIFKHPYPDMRDKEIKIVSDI